jgi:hypothetical protein
MSIIQNVSTQNSIVARAGGGQPLATQLTAVANRITTVATAGDSVKLPIAMPGKVVFLKNTSANSCNVFPSQNEVINALATNAAYALATVKSAWFVCIQVGIWEADLSA